MAFVEVFIPRRSLGSGIFLLGAQEPGPAAGGAGGAAGRAARWGSKGGWADLPVCGGWAQGEGPWQPRFLLPLLGAPRTVSSSVELSLVVKSHMWARRTQGMLRTAFAGSEVPDALAASTCLRLHTFAVLSVAYVFVPPPCREALHDSLYSSDLGQSDVSGPAG